MFQNYFNSQVDDFDELLFSYIASSGGSNRDAVGLTRDEFTDGFETFLDKGTNYQDIIFRVYKEHVHANLYPVQT